MRTGPPLVALALALASPAFAQPTPPTTPPAPTPPAVTAELTAAAAAQVGSYRCKGSVVDGDRTRPVSARLVITRELDGRWLVWRLRQDRPRAGARGARAPLAYIIYRAFDPAAKTWSSIQLDSTGGRAEQTATDGTTWTGMLRSRGVEVEIRDHQEQTGRALHLWGEYEIEPDVFERGYDVTCRK